MIRSAYAPELSSAVRSVAAEHGKKAAPLIPAHKQFPVGRIFGRIIIIAVPVPVPALFDEKRPDIRGPVGQSACTKIQARCNLPPQRIPAGSGVAGPEHSSEPLLSDVCTSGKIKYSFAAVFSSLSLVNSHGMIKGICVEFVGRHTIGYFPHIFGIENGRLGALPVAPLGGKRFAGVAPPCIRTAAEKFFPHLFPVKFPAFLIKSIVNIRCGKKQIIFMEFPVIFRAAVHVWPYRNHEMNVFLVKLPYHVLHIRESCFVQRFLPPQTVAP